MIILSLILNIIVLFPVCYLLLTNSHKMEKVLGRFYPAIGILLAIYTTILLASILFILLLFVFDVKFALALFCIQVVYKLLTPLTVKTIKNPVVINNVLIAVVHLITIFTTLDNHQLIFNMVP